MRFARLVARFNRVVTNPIQRHWAGRIPLHAIVEHVGRRTGKPYRTPVMAYRRGDRLNILVGYGIESDWVRNLQAAGGGGAVRRGEPLRLGAPTMLTGADAKAALPRLARLLVSQRRPVLSLPILPLADK
ncbi:MAG: nitroreductase family deazaflavin-dependent oxidoreductase [Acidimicrobiales bacterium]